MADFTWIIQDHFRITRSLITSAKTLFRNKVTFSCQREGPDDEQPPLRLPYAVHPVASQDSHLSHVQNRCTPSQHPRESQPIRASIRKTKSHQFKTPKSHRLNI